MKETIKELEKKLEELSKTFMNFIKVMDNLALIKFDDTEKKRSMISDIRKMYHKTEEDRQLVIDAISALQKVCTHTNPDGSNAYHYNGNDSHYSYEKCDICGKEQKT
jgi:hypothetical protein